jgi:hypothetical protein
MTDLSVGPSVLDPVHMGSIMDPRGSLHKQVIAGLGSADKKCQHLNGSMVIHDDDDHQGEDNHLEDVTKT